MDDTANIKSRSFISAASLFFQSGYSSALGLVANLILTVLLSPAVFGIYITVLTLISLLNYFSDIGMAASLIQKKELHHDDIKTTFTVQQMLILILISLGFLATSYVATFYRLPREGVYLYWALLVGFFLSSLKTIPSVLLERQIKFQKIVFVQIIENTAFYITVVTLALLNFGIHSFTVGVIIRAIVGVTLIYSISFWKPSLGISVVSLKHVLSFGLPFQASSFLALFKDDLIILFLSKLLGFEAVGYIGWAKKWAEAPIRIIMDNTSRIIFPLIARFQDDTPKVGRLIEKTLFYQSALITPAILGMALIMEHLVLVIPNYQKWTAALPLFYVFCLSSLVVSFTAPFMNLFNALGKVKITFSYMLFWTILTWTLTPLFVNFLNAYGFSLAHLVVSLSGVLIIFKAKTMLEFRFFPSIYKVVLASVFMSGILFSILSAFGVATFPQIIALIIFGISIYYLCIRYVFQIPVLQDIKSFLIK